MSQPIAAAHVAHLLPASAAGILEPPERQRVLAHLAGCPACRAELAAWEAIRDALREPVPEAPADDAVLRRVWRRLDGLAESTADAMVGGGPDGGPTTPVPRILPQPWPRPQPNPAAKPGVHRTSPTPHRSGRIPGALGLLATAALVLLTLVAGYAASRGFRPAPDLEQTERVPAPIAPLTATELFDASFPTGALPPWDAAWSAFDHDTLPPDNPADQALPELELLAPGRSDASPPRAFRYPSLRLEYVLEGSYVVRADGPLQLARAGSGTLADVPPGTEVVLSPGDATVAPPTTATEYANPGSTPAELLMWTAWAQDGLGGDLLPGWTIRDYEVLDGVALPTGPSRLRLRRVEVPPDGVIPAAPAGIQLSVSVPRNAAGERVSPEMLHTQGDGSVRNVGRHALTAYVVTLEPVGGAAAPGTPGP